MRRHLHNGSARPDLAPLEPPRPGPAADGNAPLAPPTGRSPASALTTPGLGPDATGAGTGSTAGPVDREVDQDSAGNGGAGVREDSQLLALIDGVPDYDYVAHTETLRGVVRQRLVTRALREHLPPAPARIVDVGGGTGVQALALARLGYHVTVCEPDERMVAEATRAFAAAPRAIQERIRLVQGDGLEVASLVGTDFDATLCHGVIMFIPEPEKLLRVLVEVTRPGGTISVVGKNGPALALRAGLQGRWQDVRAQLADADPSHGPGTERPRGGQAGHPSANGTGAQPVVLGPAPANRGDDPSHVRAVLAAEGAEPLAWYGIRTFTDHLGDEPLSVDVDEVVEAEWAAGARDPYRQVARLIHLVHRRRL